METARGPDGEDSAQAIVLRVRDKLAWMQGIVEEGLARVEPGGRNAEDASDADGGDV